VAAVALAVAAVRLALVRALEPAAAWESAAIDRNLPAPDAAAWASAGGSDEPDF
jgi:hypothetical protein